MILNQTDFQYVREIVLKESGVIIREDMDYFVESRLASVARLNSFSTIDDLILSSKTTGSGIKLKNSIVEAMMIVESSFFRDPHYFDVIRENVIPAIIKDHGENYDINIWSAASSQGQEIYSVALMIDHNKLIPSTWEVNYFASDFSGELINRAKNGLYNQFEVNRGLSNELVQKYFINSGSNLQVNQTIRDRIKFMKYNLLENHIYFPQMDIIFLRNVMIYFSASDKKKVLENVAKRLKPNGYLILGSTESILNNPTFEPIDFQKAIMYKRR